MKKEKQKKKTAYHYNHHAFGLFYVLGDDALIC